MTLNEPGAWDSTPIAGAVKPPVHTAGAPAQGKPEDAPPALGPQLKKEAGGPQAPRLMCSPPFTEPEGRFSPPFQSAALLALTLLHYRAGAGVVGAGAGAGAGVAPPGLAGAGAAAGGVAGLGGVAGVTAGAAGFGAGVSFFWHAGTVPTGTMSTPANRSRARTDERRIDMQILLLGANVPTMCRTN